MMKAIGPDHPITVEPSQAHVRVIVGGQVVVDTTRALTLRESSYPPVYYVPRRDANMALLERTDHSTTCPYKGQASYYTIRAGGKTAINAVWSYEAPYDQVGAIKEHLAFYPDRVDNLQVS